MKKIDSVVSKRKIRGQGMTEYIIIVALIAIAAITVFTLFGNTIRTQVAGMATELSGQDAGTVITAAQGHAAAAVTDGATEKSLGTYNNDQQ